MKQNYFLYIVLIAAMAGCKKEPNYEEIEFGYEYFPNLTGSFIEYQVQTIQYGETNDTTVYFLRELIAESFVDAVGHPATRVERYKRQNILETYVLDEVWVQKRTATLAERVEDNQRYIRLVFPPEVGKSWNGNAYNTFEQWDYTITSIGESTTIGAFTFDETLRVNQRDNVNLIEQQVAWEVYAKDVGLIEKYYKNLEFQDFVITGEETEMRVIGFGSIN